MASHDFPLQQPSPGAWRGWNRPFVFGVPTWLPVQLSAQSLHLKPPDAASTFFHYHAGVDRRAFENKP
eukprot:3726361-Amphidinium_carterae.1